MEDVASMLAGIYLLAAIIVLLTMIWIVVDICRIIKHQSHKTKMLLKSDRELRGRLIDMEATVNELVKVRQRPLVMNCSDK